MRCLRGCDEALSSAVVNHALNSAVANHPPLVRVQGAASANGALRQLLDSHKWAAPSALALRKRQTSDAAAAEAGGDAAAAGSAPSTPHAGSTAPPAALVDHLPLAVYCNGLLAAFNELRHCAPLSCRLPVAQQLQASLVAASSAMAHYGLTHPLSEAEQAAFDAACRAHTATLCPYIAVCFERIYPSGAAMLDLRAVAQPLADMAAEREGS